MMPEETNSNPETHNPQSEAPQEAVKKPQSLLGKIVKRTALGLGLFLAGAVTLFYGDKHLNDKKVWNWVSDKLSGRTEEKVQKDAREKAEELSSNPAIPDNKREIVRKNLKELYLGLEEYLDFKHPDSYKSKRGVATGILDKVMDAAVKNGLIDDFAKEEWTRHQMIYENKGIGAILDSIGIKGPISDYGRSNSDAWKRGQTTNNGKPIPTVAEIFSVERPKDQAPELKQEEVKPIEKPQDGIGMIPERIEDKPAFLQQKLKNQKDFGDRAADRIAAKKDMRELG